MTNYDDLELDHLRRAAIELHSSYLPFYEEWFLGVGIGCKCIYIYCKSEPEIIMFPETYKGFPVIPKIIGASVQQPDKFTVVI